MYFQTYVLYCVFELVSHQKTICEQTLVNQQINVGLILVKNLYKVSLES